MSDDDAAFFLFSAIVSFQFHPGFKKESRLTPIEALVEVEKYFLAFKRFQEEGVWRGSVQRSEQARRF